MSVHNFNPGPAILPQEVLQEAQAELLNYRDTGISILETSHRARPYEDINREAEASIKELLHLQDNYRVLFLQGGASTQFAMIPMNFLTAGQTANYVLTGVWAEKALKEAALLGQTHVAASTADKKHCCIPGQNDIHLSSDPAYIHLTSNNTIYGTQWQNFPSFGEVPLIADMSSDIFSRSFDASRFALIYAGAQKNLGPAGVTVVIIRQDLLERCPKTIPTMLRYSTHAANDSLYNTPPTFAVYMVNLVLRWIKSNGGLTGMEKRNREKAALIYAAIDASQGFYAGHAELASRSLMNITFRLPSAELEKQFVSESAKAGLIGLKGHRLVGGLRASVYNAMSREGCQALQNFMKEFQRKNG